MTVGVTDSRRIYAVRYASGGEVNTLFVSEDAFSVRMLYPENERLAHFSDDTRVVVSEPLADLPGRRPRTELRARRAIAARALY
jgi:glutamine amidotransferase